MKRMAIRSVALTGLLLALLAQATTTHAIWRFGDERYYNDNKVCRDGIELGLADTTGNTPPIIYKNIGAVLYTNTNQPLPETGDSSTYAPISDFGDFVHPILPPSNITLPQQSTPITMPDSVQTSVYITSTLRWSQLLTPDQIVVLSRDNTVNGRSANDAYAYTTVTDCYFVAPPTIIAQIGNQTINSGRFATLQVSTSGGMPRHYQWYQGAKGDTSVPVGRDAAAFTTPALTTTTSYWVRVSNVTANVDSAALTVTVEPNKLYLPVVKQ